MNKAAFLEGPKQSFKDLMGDILNTKGGRAALRSYINDPRNYNTILKMVLKAGNNVLAAPEAPIVHNVNGIIEKRAAFIKEAADLVTEASKADYIKGAVKTMSEGQRMASLLLLGAAGGSMAMYGYKTLKKENKKLKDKKIEKKASKATENITKVVEHELKQKGPALAGELTSKLLTDKSPTAIEGRKTLGELLAKAFNHAIRETNKLKK